MFDPINCAGFRKNANANLQKLQLCDGTKEVCGRRRRKWMDGGTGHSLF